MTINASSISTFFKQAQPSSLKEHGARQLQNIEEKETHRKTLQRKKNPYSRKQIFLMLSLPVGEINLFYCTRIIKYEITD